MIYGKGRTGTIYDAKVLKIEYEVKPCDSSYKYFVHYCGWSNRYDEWVYPGMISKVVRDPVPRGGRRVSKQKNKVEPASMVVRDGWPPAEPPVAPVAVDRKC